jgi:glucose/arabinose dehydrogenase
VPDAIASLHNSHSNGSLVFGTDGTLLLLTGEGAHYDVFDPGGVDDPGFDDWTHPVTGLRGPTPKDQDHGAYRSQMLNTLAGKVLRIDPETGLGLPSNPFYDGDPASNASRVWALGLRNPYRGSLVQPGSTDPALGDPGVLVLGDVGWADWEEVDLCSGGENFGWPCYEAGHANGEYLDYDPPGSETQACEGTPVGTLTPPIASWSHQDTSDYTPPGSYVAEDGTPLPEGFLGACAAGATAYQGGGYPDEYDGRVFFADYAAGWIKTAELDANGQVVALRPFYQTTSTLTEVARHPLTGDLYFISNFGGKLIKLRYVDPAWVKTIGCGVNPPGSLVLEEPMAAIAETVHFTLDNPLGTQSAGAATVLALSAAPDAAYPCGALIPGFGMAGLGALGELLINPLPGAVLDPVPGPPWKAAPATLAVKVPFLFTLVGQKVYLQGAIVDTTFGGGSGAGIALTEGLELVIGS